MISLNETSQQFIKNLTDSFLATVLEQVKEEAAITIKAKMSELDLPAMLQEQIHGTVIPFFTNDIKQKMEQDVEARLDEADVVSLINKHIVNVLIPRMETQSRDQIVAEVTQRLSAVNIADLAKQQATIIVKDMIKDVSFPDASIPGQAVDTSTLKLSGNNITGGIIKNLESTGIQDSASRCQVTILDAATVFENRLVATGLEITGDTTFKGKVIIEGDLPTTSPFVSKLVELVTQSFNDKYDQGTFDQYCARVFDKIVDEGIDASLIKVNEQSIVVQGVLAGSVVHSNLQSVGALKELQVIGETLLDQTLYASNRRVGINTIDPESALDIWDQEVQVVIGKRQQDTAIIGTTRNQKLVISANNRDQLTVNTDGSVSVKSLNIGNANHTSSPFMPTDNRAVASVVWNESPVLGGPIGWVSLGGARWAPFGIING
jgi:hypothetical protein